MSAVNFQKFLRKHKSGWIALTPDNKKEVASGKTLNAVLSSAKKKGVSKPSVFKIPNLETYYVG